MKKFGGSEKGWRWPDSSRSEIGQQILALIGSGSFDDPVWRQRYTVEYNRLWRADNSPEADRRRMNRREINRLGQQRRRQRLRSASAALA